MAELIDLLAEHGLDDRVAFTELHNEVQVGHLADGPARPPRPASWPAAAAGAGTRRVPGPPPRIGR